MTGYAAYADSNCPALKVSNDPFADLDDVMTEEEKRQALHLDLKRKLSSHKPSCPPSSKTTKENSSANPGQSAGSGASAGQQNSGQASGQNPSGQNGSQGAAQPAGSQNGGQSAGKTGSSNQSIPANGVSGQGTAGSGGKYSSPWGTQSSSASNSGAVSLEPMPVPSQASQATPSTKIKSQAATNIAGAGPSPKSPKSPATTAGQPSSEFLKIYGEEGSPPPRESLEEIANRYNNRSKGQYGSPGNTGTNSHLNYSNTGKTTAKSQTIKADDGVIKALQERLASETNPEKKKQIQAEIDRLKN